jgi:WD40 repeat protein
MKVQCVLRIAAVVCLGTASLVYAQTAAVVRQRDSVAVPIPVGAARGPNGPTLECVATVGPAVPVAALAFGPEGKTLAAGGYQEVVVWDLAEAKLAKRIGVGQLSDSVHALALSKDGRLLAVGEGVPHASGAVHVFDMESGQGVASFQEPKDLIYSVAFSPDGKLLAAAAADSVVYVWNVEEKKLATSIKEHGDWAMGVSFSPDGKLLATGSADQTVQIWEVEGWKSALKLRQPDAVSSVAFSPDGSLLAFTVSGPNERSLRILKVETEPKAGDTDAKKSQRQGPPQTRNMDTGIGLPLGVAWVMPPTTPAPAAQPPAGKAPPPPTGKIFVACSDKTVKVSNPNGNLNGTLAGHGDWVYCVAASPDGTKIASGSADGTVKLWNAADNRPLATLVQLAPRSEDWLIVTAQGYVAGSSLGGLKWKTSNMTTAAEQIGEMLQKADLVREAIAGNKTANPALK